MQPGSANTGWQERNRMFRQNYDAQKPFRKSGLTLFGRLMHELVGCETGLPPNTKVRFELDRSENDFLIMKEETDSEKYQVKILNIALFVPVAQLSSAVFNEISTILTRKSEPKAISIHYRRIEIRPISLPKNKEEYYSESLFQDADLPCRIVVCFVETAHKNGTQTSNPFAFFRSWKIEQNSQLSKASNADYSESVIENLVDNRFLRLEKQFQNFLSSLGQSQPPKTSRKGKAKKTKECEPEQTTSQAANERLRSFMEGNSSTRPSTSSDADSIFTEDILTDPTYKTIYIKKIDCQLNSNSLDQVEDKANEDECMQMYWRMFKFNGQLNSLFTNGISYDDFRNGYFFAVFDLSTSGKCGTNYVVPSIRVGHLRIR